ncbi:uracil-DNA glycosylase family protein [Pelotomaculum propionicicum]|uniref:uracil-DNA glycosylase family protein n=1 Tax=Pelotomaculum propionicicum TaxID=258475 RepID=UPI003B7D0891
MKLVDKDAVYLREGLDILFIALNPPRQSNANGHYFSGRNSRFFKQLFKSGLITENLNKLVADDLVFGGTKFNYKNKLFGVIDLKPRTEETNSNKVRVMREEVILMIDRIRRYRPRRVCIIHSEVRKQFGKMTGITLQDGFNGKVLEGCDTDFYYNHFPNGSNIPDEVKIDIYRIIRDSLDRQ